MVRKAAGQSVFDIWSVARAETTWTPREAARIKAQTIALQLCTDPDPRLDKFMRWHGQHQWFVYCLDAVARRA